MGLINGGAHTPNESIISHTNSLLFFFCAYIRLPFLRAFTLSAEYLLAQFLAYNSCFGLIQICAKSIDIEMGHVGLRNIVCSVSYMWCHWLQFIFINSNLLKASMSYLYHCAIPPSYFYLFTPGTVVAMEPAPLRFASPYLSPHRYGPPTIPSLPNSEPQSCLSPRLFSHLFFPSILLPTIPLAL